MTRVIFPNNEQQTWLSKISERSKFSSNELAEICEVSGRTFRDWRKGKFTISGEALSKLSTTFNEPIPSTVKTVEDFWYVKKGARKGALRRFEIYGSLGTTEGRKKGGRNSQINRKLHPELYANCILRKDFSFPQKSNELAELVGIILGDGGITDWQLKIYLNKETEPEYVEYVAKLIDFLFKKPPKKYYFGGTSQKVCVLCLAGINLIEFLEQIGLIIGNKVSLQVGVPKWVLKNRNYSIACLRGLVDTDGCVYSHKHTTKGFSCLNYGLTLTNHSKPLLNFAHTVLLKERFTSKIKEHAVYLYRQKEVQKYFDIIGSHNQHHFREFENILEKKKLRRSTQEA